MIKKTIAYTDFDGNERSEDFYFNLTKAECMELEMGITGGLSKMINEITATQDIPKVIELFKKILLKSYGVKSPDGKRFIKNDEIAAEFSQTQAYSDLFMELATDSEEAARFINGIIPQNTETPATIAAKN